MTKLVKALALLVMLMLVVPNVILAYSYGDPNQDEVAESFKEIAVKLNASSVDWKGASEIYKVRRAEIASHFGESIAVTLDHNFADKNKALVLSNFKYVLVLNLDRRFEYALKDIEDYAKSKLLLAKAKGTFGVLSPYVEAKKPGLESKILIAFDAALEALGNPGLFGVGEESVNPQEFEKQTSYILQSVKPLFPYTAYKIAATPKPTAAPTKKPETNTVTATPLPADKQTATPVATATPAEVTAAPMEETPLPTESPETSAAPVESVEPGPENSSGSNEDGNDQPSPAAEGAEHAPMERSDKTNPFISVLIIGGAVLIIGGGVWYARKKGLI
ncbi:MAG TPA: hypothetical protein VGE40_07710 [Bacilli bacterium]